MNAATAAGRPLPAPRSRWVFVTALLANVLFYLWIAHPQLPLPLALSPADEPYNQLTDALLVGQTSLKELPHPELLALPDPYDPIRNHMRGSDGRVLALHDMSLFKGRYYVYFGVVPALTTFVPYKWVTGIYLPTYAAALIYALGALIWSSLLLQLALERWFPATPKVVQLLALLGVGVCNLIPFLLATALTYEVAIVAGQCFVLGGLYWLARAVLAERFHRGQAALGSLLLGLAIGCRPHLALVGVLVLGGLAVLLAALARIVPIRERFLRLLSLGVPWVVAVGLLGLYNFVRFESFTEFGARYALVGSTVHVFNNQLLRANRIGIDLYCYLFFSPVLTGEFPYVQLVDPPQEWLPPDHFGTTPLAGVLVGLPFLRVLFLTPFVLLAAWRRRQGDYLGALVTLLAAGSVTLLFLSLFGLTMRYEIDFVGFFVLAAMLVALRVETNLQNAGITRWAFRSVMLVLLLVSGWFSLAISFLGQRSSPCDLARLERWRAVAPRWQAEPEPMPTARRRTTPAMLTSKRGGNRNSAEATAAEKQ